MDTIVLVTGGWDPLHSGHIAYINAAKALGDVLLVGVNSDDWLVRKKGRAFMPIVERVAIIENLKAVDGVILFNDDDDSAREAIKNVRFLYPNSKIIFANGGDRTRKNIPEMDIADGNIEFVFGVGGNDKKNSSSWILEEWKSPKTIRPWGYYRVVYESQQCKVKELTVNPKSMLSMQRHRDRSEHWFVAEGEATVYTVNRSTDVELLDVYVKHQHVHIPAMTWHQLCNETTQPLKIVEIQYGSRCEEEDIQRQETKQ